MIDPEPIPNLHVAVLVDPDERLLESLALLFRLDLGLPSITSQDPKGVFDKIGTRVPVIFVIGDDPHTPDGTGTILGMVRASYPQVGVITLWRDDKYQPMPGARGLLKQPIDPDEFLRTVRSMLGLDKPSIVTIE